MGTSVSRVALCSKLLTRLGSAALCRAPSDSIPRSVSSQMGTPKLRPTSLCQRTSSQADPRVEATVRDYIVIVRCIVSRQNGSKKARAFPLDDAARRASEARQGARSESAPIAGCGRRSSKPLTARASCGAFTDGADAARVRLFAASEKMWL
jgi:hypothetical protein